VEQARVARVRVRAQCGAYASVRGARLLSASALSRRRPFWREAFCWRRAAEARRRRSLMSAEMPRWRRTEF